MVETEKRERMESIGINYKRGIERFMGNVKLYEEFLDKFLYDGSYEEFRTGYVTGDLGMAEKAVHTLKGTAGNLSMDRLSQVAGSVVQAIRNGESAEKLEELSNALETEYKKVIDFLRELHE